MHSSMPGSAAWICARSFSSAAARSAGTEGRELSMSLGFFMPRKRRSTSKRAGKPIRAAGGCQRALSEVEALRERSSRNEAVRADVCHRGDVRANEGDAGIVLRPKLHFVNATAVMRPIGAIFDDDG